MLLGEDEGLEAFLFWCFGLMKPCIASASRKSFAMCLDCFVDSIVQDEGILFFS